MTTTELFARASQIYDDQLRTGLEQSHRDFFVAVEPESGDHFLGPTLSDASAAANAVYPTRRAVVLRIGHSATVHLGAGNA